MKAPPATEPWYARLVAAMLSPQTAVAFILLVFMVGAYNLSVMALEGFLARLDPLITDVSELVEGNKRMDDLVHRVERLEDR